MKRIASFLSVILVTVITFSAMAQLPTIKASNYLMPNDTTVLLNAKTVIAKSLYFTNVGAAKTTTITYTLTRNSGTSAGVVRLEGTVDGTNWHKIDSLVLANTLTNKKYWIQTDNAFTAYRTVTIGSGTQNGTPKSNILMRVYPKD